MKLSKYEVSPHTFIRYNWRNRHFLKKSNFRKFENCINFFLFDKLRLYFFQLYLLIYNIIKEIKNFQIYCLIFLLLHTFFSLCGICFYGAAIYCWKVAFKNVVLSHCCSRIKPTSHTAHLVTAMSHRHHNVPFSSHLSAS